MHGNKTWSMKMGKSSTIAKNADEGISLEECINKELSEKFPEFFTDQNDLDVQNCSEIEFEVARDSNIHMGRPTIKGTRWPIHHLAKIAQEEGIDSVLRDWKSLNRTVIEKSIEWAKENPAS